MTCIVGIAHEGQVWIGGDSCGWTSSTVIARADEKVFRNGAYLMGFTSSFRMGQLLRYRLEVEAPDTWDVRRFMVVTFVDAVRQCLKDGGYAGTSSDDSGGPSGSEEGGTFLVGVGGQLFTIDSDYQVGIAHDGYAAVGSGEQVALGSLYTTRGWTDPERRIQVALEAAAHTCPGVRGPFTVVSS